MERENIENVDVERRYDDEWSAIYKIAVVDGDVNSEKMSEFEWAFRLNRASYMLLPDADGSYDTAATGEARAMAILTDIMANADHAERKILRDGSYFETKYILKYLTTH